MERESDAGRFPFQISRLVEETAGVHVGRFRTLPNQHVVEVLDQWMFPFRRITCAGVGYTESSGKINRLAGSVSGVRHVIQRVRLSTLHMIDRPLCDTRS